MDRDEGPRLRILRQMATVVKKHGLSIISSRTNPEVVSEMSELDFRNMIIDFPLTLSSNDISILVRSCPLSREGQGAHRRGVNYPQFIDDLLAVDDHTSMPCLKSGQVNAKYVALAKYLFERSTDLLTLVSYLDKGHTGIASAANFARALP
jgi:hypothetical protein